MTSKRLLRLARWIFDLLVVGALGWIAVTPLVSARHLLDGKDFYATCAQVIPVLLLAWAVDLRLGVPAATRANDPSQQIEGAVPAFGDIRDEIRRGLHMVIISMLSSVQQAFTKWTIVLVAFAELASLTALASGGAPVFVGVFILITIVVFGLLLVISLISRMQAHERSRLLSLGDSLGLPDEYTRHALGERT